MARDIKELLERTGGLLESKIRALPPGTIYTVGDENPINIEFVGVKNEMSGHTFFKAGRGVTKTAYYVVIRSGNASGQPAVLLTPVVPSENDLLYIKTIVDNQQKAHELGYAPKPYTYSLYNNGIIVSERVTGENICRMRDLSVEQQFAIIKATLDLHTHNLYQGDPNCGNYYIDGTKLAIIDDIVTSDEDTIHEVLRILMTIQYANRDFAIRKFARYMYITNKPFFPENKRTAPLQGLTQEQITDIGQDFYNRAIALFKEYDKAELASAVAEPNTYFKVNGGVYKHIRTVDTGLFCKRLGEDGLWSTEESRIEMDSLSEIPVNGIFRFTVQAGGGLRTTRRTRKLRPPRRKNVRKSVRRKHT